MFKTFDLRVNMRNSESLFLFLSFMKAIRHEAFTHIEGHKEFVQIDHNDLFPYLLVNIGSGVSMIKVNLRFISLFVCTVCCE